MNPTEHNYPQEFRQLLQQELLRRCKNNPKYSLRAFAKMLEVSSSALSAMINGKRPISEASRTKLGLKLGLKLEDLKKYSQQSQDESNNYQQLTFDTFAVISEWYHYAILEVTHIRGFISDAGWIARRLGITKSEVNIAIERLIRLEMLEITEDGDWKDASGRFVSNISEGFTSQGAKNFQKQILGKAIEAIESVPLIKRDNTSMTMAINTEDLPEARKMMKEFRRNLTAFLERSGNGKYDEVYHLGLAFYPVTQNMSGEIE